MREKKRQLLDHFLQYETMRGKRQSSLNRLKYDLKHLFNFLEEQDLSLVHFKIIHAFEFQGYLQDLVTAGGSPVSHYTVNACMSAAACFFTYLKKKKKAASNPFKEVRRMRSELKLPRHLFKEKEMQSFLRELEHFDCGKDLKEQVSLYRLHVISELMYASGLRVSEAAHLKESDLDLFRNLILVKEGKRGKSRTVFLNDYAACLLKLYLDLKPYLTTKWHRFNDTLFGLKRESFSRFVNKYLKIKCERLKLPVQTSHCFRHALGYHLLRSGCDIRYIQMILGHEKLHTTEIYTRVEKEDLKNVLDDYHPRQLRGHHG